MQVRFNWPDDQKATYDNIWGSAGAPSAMIGAILAIRVMKWSRRMTLYGTTLISAVSICLQIIENQWLILAGRFILGFAMAFMAVSTARFLEEFTPMHLFGTVLTMQGFL